MIIFDDDEQRSVFCREWNVPADYACLLAGCRDWKASNFAIFRASSFEVNYGECVRYFAYCEMGDYFSADEFEMIEPDVWTFSFGDCLRQLFAGIADGDMLYFCDKFADDEVREVLRSLGGDVAVSAYFSGVSLDDIFAGW